MELDENTRKLKMKRQRSSDEEEEPSYKLSTLNNTQEYRTVKRRRGLDDTNSETISPSSPTSSESDDDDDDDFSSDDDLSFWGSDESDDEDERTEEIASKETNMVKTGECLDSGNVPTNIKSDFVDHRFLDGDYDYKLLEEEQTVLALLANYWSSQVATKASKERGYVVMGDSCSLCNSPEITKLQLRAVKKLMSLPCVVSVGIKRDGAQVNVTVSDRTKALELSKELNGPNINLIEARNSHFI